MRHTAFVKKINQAYVLVQEWRLRARTRRYLADMSPHKLCDIGVGEVERQEEVNKPFWRP